MTRRIYEPYAYSDAARTECIWPLPDHPWSQLDGDVACEVAVIGGGYTGLSAALHLAQSGVSVTLLESEKPGWGASGRNGGFCCVGGDKLGFTKIAKRFGNDAAKAYFTTQCDAIDLVRNILDTHNIDADTHSDGELQLAHRPQAVSDLKSEAEQLRNLGVSSLFIPGDALADHGMSGTFQAGLHVRLGFALNPGKYVFGLARAAQEAGADIRAHSPVTRITREGGRYVLHATTGTLRAKKLILATNGYSSDDIPNWLRGRYMPLQSNILVTRVLSDEEIAAQGWTTDLMAYDTRNLLHYFRMLPDRRFLMGTRGNIAATPQGQLQMRGKIQRDLSALFPQWAHVETPNFWSGLVSLSRDLLPYIGPIGHWKNAWTGMNYHGNGLAMSTWAGAQLAQLAMGKTAGSKVHQSPLKRFPMAAFRRNYLHAAFLGYRLIDGPAPSSPETCNRRRTP